MPRDTPGSWRVEHAAGVVEVARGLLDLGPCGPEEGGLGITRGIRLRVGLLGQQDWGLGWDWVQ